MSRTINRWRINWPALPDKFESIIAVDITPSETFSTFTHSSQKSKALLYVVAGGVLVSFSGVFVETAHVGPTVSAFYRVLFGGLILMGISLFRGRPLFKTNRLLGLAAACGLFFAVDLFFWHRSVLFVGPGLATILGNFQVFFLAMVGTLFMGERPGLRFWLSIALAMAGLYLIIGTDWSKAGADYRLGVWLGLATAVAYAAYLIVLQYSQRSRPKLAIMPNMAVVSLSCALVLGTVVWARGQESFIIPDVQSWASLITLGITGQVLGWVLISRGLPDIETSVAGLTLLIQPALAFIWDILFFGRPTTWLEALGAVVALGAIYVGSVSGKTAKH